MSERRASADISRGGAAAISVGVTAAVAVLVLAVAFGGQLQAAIPSAGAGSLPGNLPTASAAPATVEPIPANAAAYVPGELIVGLSDEGASDATAAEAAKRAIESVGFSPSTLSHASSYAGTTLLVSTGSENRSGDGLADAAATIGGLPGVACVQPNYRSSASSARAADIAFDEDVAKQYYLNSPEEHGANIAAAWEKATTSNRVGVAVLDTGAYVMPEYDNLGANLVVNDDSLHQDFDSENLDIEHAVDFVHSTDNGNPKPLVNEENPYGDDNGHGTHGRR